MKKIFLSLLFATFLWNQHVSGQNANNLKTFKDSLSYAIGAHLSALLNDFAKEDIDLNLIQKTINDCWNSGKMDMDDQTKANILRSYFTEIVPQRIKTDGKKYMDSIRNTHPNIKATESGLLYEIVNPGDNTQKLSSSDIFVVDYVTKLPDGRTVDSSADRGQSLSLTPSQVIPGFGEGVMLIGKGGKIKLWIPEELAYGSEGAGEAIPPYSPLYFEIDLKDIVKASTDVE